MTLALRYLAHSEVGLVRKNNQDSAYTSANMLVVADGMGGAAAGDLASAIAVGEFRAADVQLHGQEMLDAAAEAIRKAGVSISEFIAAEPELDGMGSTVCAILFDGEQLGLVNIGDSRAYRYRDQVLTRLTRDHSWVQTLVDEGRITEEEALEHPHRSLILRVINGQPQHLPEMELVDVAEGDRLLVCSDGLSGLVTDQMLAAAMRETLPQTMSTLIELAHSRGGHDNITIVLADVVDGTPEGPVGLLGAASLIDLDDPLTTTAKLPSMADPDPEPEAAEEVRYAPTVKRKGSAWLKVTLAVLLPLLMLGAAGFGWYSYTQRQYFVGAHDINLAIFQGVPEPVFNLPLSRVVQTDSTRLADLPVYYQEQVRNTIPAESLADAQATLDTLRIKAVECIAQRRARPTPPPSPTPTLSPGPGAATPTGTTPAPTPDPMEC